MNQGGRTASWSSVPSRVTGIPPSGRTMSWNGRVFGVPRQKSFAGLTRTLAKPAMPGLDDDAGRLDVEAQEAVGVGGLDLGVEPDVAAVVDREVVAGGPAAARRPRDQLGERFEERADLDDALLDRRAGGVFPRPGMQAERHRAGWDLRAARRPEDDPRRLLGAREERDRRRLDGRPAGRVAEDVQRELVDDRAGVPAGEAPGSLRRRARRRSMVL